MALSFDKLIWKFIVPLLRQNYFKNRIFSEIALRYIRLYRFPARLFKHYLKASGQDYLVDSAYILNSSSYVRDKLAQIVMAQITRENSGSGVVVFSQTEISEPGLKYALGSFRILYSIKNQIVNYSVHSVYTFENECDRLTRFLHRSMFELTSQNRAAAFQVVGLPSTIRIPELCDQTKKSKKYDNLKITYLLV